MNQSIFVLGALVSAMIFSFAQQRTVVDSELRRIDQFYQSRSSKEATDLLDRFERLPFDPVGAVEDPDSLSLEGTATEVSDVGDVQSLNDVGELTAIALNTADSLQLYATVDVQFVEPTGDGAFAVSQDPTFYKEVTVTVEPWVSGAPDGVTLSRVYSFAPEP